MSANNAFHIAVLAGDGIGPEVMAPALEVLRKIEAKSDLRFRFTEAPAGANNYLATGKSMPDSTIKLCEEADAILLGACGLPSVRYPDNTEIAPQIELRFIFDLYAGVRPARLIPGVPSPIVGADQRGIDLVVIRESTEGLFASMGKGIVTHEDARETLVITRRTSERLFEFSFRLAERRKARGKQGSLACVDKANVFKAFAFFRGIFDEIAKNHPEVKTDRLYVDACAAMLVKRPWDFDVMVMENMASRARLRPASKSSARWIRSMPAASSRWNSAAATAPRILPRRCLPRCRRCAHAGRADVLADEITPRHA
jgi:3-isopropylmalate dehydrogenase